MADVEGGIRQLQTRRDGVFSSESRWRNGMDRGELGANLEYQEFLWYVASPASYLVENKVLVNSTQSG
jgi:hypothetical protein